jgi:hypothetical protein
MAHNVQSYRKILLGGREMKKLLITAYLIAICFFIMAPAVHAYNLTTGEITLTQNSYSYGVGGEFTATPSASLTWLLDNYNANAKNGRGFETFCMEYNEEFYPGHTYIASISDRAYDGGVGPQGDPVSIGTAYLYSQFAQGILAGYFTGDRQAHAGQLQLAIWWLEQEKINGNLVAYDSSNPFMKIVFDKFGGVTGAQADAIGQYGVSVLNLTDANGGLVQDQLVYNSVPEPASLLLFGLGLLGLTGIRRKMKK